jgi:hypothetical protein
LLLRFLNFFLNFSALFRNFKKSEENLGNFFCSWVWFLNFCRNVVRTFSRNLLFSGDIEGSSFIVVVSPGAPSADTTFCTGEGTKGARAGEPAPVIATTMDECGNRVTTGGAPLSATLTFQGEGGATVPVDVKG